MKDPGRIDEIIELIKQLWSSYPDWRFGQLICNISTKLGYEDPFFVEDDLLKKKIEELLESTKHFSW